MRKLKKLLKINFYISFILINIIYSHLTYADTNYIEIKGNNFTDDDVIFSLIKNQPTELSEEYSNYLIKTLDKSKLFKDVNVKIYQDKYIISITEFPSINKIYFKNNERLKDDELNQIINELQIFNLNDSIIQDFISETLKIYQSFGYNNAKITYYDKFYPSNNTSDLFFEFEEGDITKINTISFVGNNSVDNETLKDLIKSKVKTIVNVFANNNYKKFQVENDLRIIENYYKNIGYIDIKIDFKVVYLQNNKVNISYIIDEGELYKFKKIEIVDINNILTEKIIKNLNENIISSNLINNNFSVDKINELSNTVSNNLINEDINLFEVEILEKKENNEISIIFNILKVVPRYANQINIYGNSRTFDHVIRRELELIEGDAVYKSKIEKIRKRLNSLNLFKSVEIIEKEIDENLVDININIEEQSTGTVNAGLSLGTLDGFAVVAGLSERNFYGTGRSLNALVNTSEDKTEFTFLTTDRLLYENNVDLTIKANYKEESFSSSKSYNLNTFKTGLGISYDLNSQIRHNVQLDYLIKDYKITNFSTVANAIGNSSGENISFLLRNNLYYSSLNSFYIPKNGSSFNFTNLIETPSSSSNGYIKNILILKKYKKFNKNIISAQGILGNITSLNNRNILDDDKFSLGGRWLRGFDNYGAGPRNSRTSYVGGNNLISTKFDYSRELTKNSDYPLLINLFNDYGLLWENKTKPTNNDNNLRASVGIGIRYYSPIGPIGLSWGFPIIHESYDIKRMFLFSVGNID